MKTAKTTGIMHSLTPVVADYDYELPEHGELQQPAELELAFI
jgi:hypothetical protein